LKQLEEQRLAEERRRELEKLDNWRERGLNDMMGGVLQVRREDELKKVRFSCFLFAIDRLRFSRKFQSQLSYSKKRKTIGLKSKNKPINNIFKKSKNNKKNEINYVKFLQLNRLKSTNKFKKIVKLSNKFSINYIDDEFSLKQPSFK